MYTSVPICSIILQVDVLPDAYANQHALLEFICISFNDRYSSKYGTHPKFVNYTYCFTKCSFSFECEISFRFIFHYANKRTV